MKDRQNLLIILLVIVTALVVIINFITKKEEEEKNDIEIVTNYSNFYTVNSCVYRVINHLALKDSKSLILLINENYKKENKITEDNVLNKFMEVSQDSTFKSKKMYYEQLESGITKYYVYGEILKNQIFDEGIEEDINGEDAYFIVYIHWEDEIFSVEPYDGEIFIGGVSNEG